MEQGLLIKRQVLPGTERILRDPEGWWDPESTKPHPKWKKGWMSLDRYQLRKQEGTTNVLCGHWTAGEAGTRDPDGDGPLTSFDDDGPWVVEIMKRRRSRKNTKRRLKASVQFVIGACFPDDEWATIWQTMELGTEWSSVHVGRGEVNRRSIGVEVVSAGRDGHLNTRDRPETVVQVFGRDLDVLEFYPGQIRSWVWLANLLSSIDMPGVLQIPRQVPVSSTCPSAPYDQRFNLRQQRKWAGGMEHYLMDNTNKVDAGTLLLQSLLDDGWEGVVVQ